MNSPEPLREQASRLKLHGLLANWDSYANAPWLAGLLAHEETERHRRSLERRLRNAHIGHFKPMADFDWNWPENIDRELIDELFTFDFVTEPANVILVGPNGVGKTTIAQNLGYQAAIRGHTVRFITASELLNDLAAQDSPSSLAGRLRRLARPALLIIDEVGYLAYDSRYADLLFEVISRRHQRKSVVLTTNRPFAEWGEVFPSSTSVVALIDRLIHRAEIVRIEGDSYRLKEARNRETERKALRSARKKTKGRKK